VLTLPAPGLTFGIYVPASTLVNNSVPSVLATNLSAYKGAVVFPSKSLTYSSS
jgi:hypothetical protein